LKIDGSGKATKPPRETVIEALKEAAAMILDEIAAGHFTAILDSDGDTGTI
jgi:hypothetical protein